MAEATGIHRVTIAKYESTDCGMTVDSATRLAEALGCTVDELLTTEKARPEKVVNK